MKDLITVTGQNPAWFPVMLALVLLTIPLVAQAQETTQETELPQPIIIEPVIEPIEIPIEQLQPRIEACLADDPAVCPMRDRLTLMRAAVAEMDRMIGQIGLFCELNPADCPATAETNRLHGLNQAVSNLLWGMPQHKIQLLLGQRPVVAARPQNSPTPAELEERGLRQ